MSKAKTYGVIALKGGVGKTSVVANLGATLAKEFKKKVLVIDGNFSTPHLGLHLGLVSPNKTLHHVLNNQIDIHDAIYEHSENLNLIPGMLSPFSVNPLLLKEKIAPLKNEYDIILIDSSPALNDEIFATMMCSDELIVVSTPDFPTLSSTLQATRLAKNKHSPIKGIIINKARKKLFELSTRDIEKASDIEVLAVLPDDVNVLAGLAEMQPIVTYKPGREVSYQYKKLAASLIDQKYRTPRIMNKLKATLKKFKKED